MGVSINLHVYDVPLLLADMDKYVADNGGLREGALPPRQFFDKIAEYFGPVVDGKFYVIWNEYYEEYNPASNFLSIVDRYYFPEDEDDWDFWSSAYSTESEGVSAKEVLSDVFEDEFGYKGKFSEYSDY